MPNRFKIGDEVIVLEYLDSKYSDVDSERYRVGYYGQLEDVVKGQTGVVTDIDTGDFPFAVRVRLHDKRFEKEEPFWFHEDDLILGYRSIIQDASLDDFFKVV